MSDGYLLATQNNLPPQVATTYVTDSGNAVPAANILNVVGDGSAITTSGSGNTITITFDSPTVIGIGQTVGAVTADIITVSPTDNKGFSAQALIIGYDTANNESIGGELIGNGKKSAGVTSIVGVPDTTIDQDAGLAAASITVIASGGDFILRVTGVAGRTIDWKAVINYLISP